MARFTLTHLALTAAVGLALAGPVQAQELSIVMDGNKVDAQPVMVDGRVMVPLRAVFEGLGASVNYDAKKQFIQAEGAAHKIALTLGQPQATVDGKEVKLEAPARMIDGKTMMPLRFVAEAFGATVKWDGATKTVHITRADVFEVKPVGDFDPKADLKRLAVGNQAAVLKVFDDTRSSVVFFKGLDDRLQAKLSPSDRTGITQAVGIPAQRVAEAADMLMGGYSQLPKRETLALLGVLGSDEAVDEECMARIRTFLADRMHNDKDVACRRQAALGLALVSRVDKVTVEEVLRFYTSRDNLWETFPVQQFFEYHAEEIRTMPGYESVVQQVSGVNSLYTKNILQYLQ